MDDQPRDVPGGVCITRDARPTSKRSAHGTRSTAPWSRCLSCAGSNFAGPIGSSASGTPSWTFTCQISGSSSSRLSSTVSGNISRTLESCRDIKSAYSCSTATIQRKQRLGIIRHKQSWWIQGARRMIPQQEQRKSHCEVEHYFFCTRGRV